ncbi:hypothetical protein J2X75_005330 [Paenibacillus sp. 2003]|nr:hypothetical protein [Paenibacillus sp. 2003]
MKSFALGGIRGHLWLAVGAEHGADHHGEHEHKLGL